MADPEVVVRRDLGYMSSLFQITTVYAHLVHVKYQVVGRLKYAG
jgi:hypothetical protein